MKKYIITICGHFAKDMHIADGQTVKTRMIYQELKKKYQNVQIIDTYNWKKNPVRLIKDIIKNLINTKNIIMLPAQNGVKVFLPLFAIAKKVFNNKIYYVVIGGWISELLKKNKRLEKSIKKIDGVFVETNRMKSTLQKMRIENVIVMPNFKNISIVNEKSIKNVVENPIRMCIFSRISKEKGIEDAIKVVEKINKEKTCVLDIYGKVELAYEDRFNKLRKKLPEYIKYKGIVEYDKSVQIIKEYDLLLFPTRFKTEGVPGTIIDAYFSGVPVIASRWDNFDEVIKENVTGVGYKFLDLEDFYIKLKLLMNKPEKILEMKKNCLIEARRFSADNCIKILTDKIGKEEKK